MSCLELLEQSVLGSLLAVRQVGGLTEKVSHWKPVINPVQDITPDGRLRAGMSSSEPLQQLICYTSLVARPQVEIRMSDWKPVINPVQDITPYGRPMEGMGLPGAFRGVSGQWTQGGMSSIEPTRQSVLTVNCSTSGGVFGPRDGPKQ